MMVPKISRPTAMTERINAILAGLVLAAICWALSI